MLTGDLVRPRMRRQGDTLLVDYLDVGQRHWRQTAQELITLLKAFMGKPYSAWEEALEKYQGERIDYVVIRGLAKVLEDAASFSPVETVFTPAEVREKLFACGPINPRIDLFNRRTRNEVLTEVAAVLGTTAQDLDLALFADRPVEYILRDVGREWTADELLHRYNMELARGVLYWASEVRVDIYDNYKDFWRYLKLFKLMFQATPLPNSGYHVELDGPISPFVSSTIRYGRQFAAFLPALFLGERWAMTADIRNSRTDQPVVYALDNTTPLQSHFKASGLFDSKLEEDFAAQFEEKLGDKRGQWLLKREDEVVILKDTVMIPDFSLTHKKDGRRALIEIVGYWHPDYLRRKVAKVREAGLKNLVLLVYEGVNLAAEKLADVPGEVLYFPNKPVIRDVMAAVESCAV